MKQIVRDLFIVLAIGAFPLSVMGQDSAGERTEPLVYTNSACGIQVTAPSGWLMYRGMRRHPEILAVFSRLPYESIEADNPRIVLFREKVVRRGPGSVMAKAYRDAEVVGLMKNLPEIESAELLEGPRLAEESASPFFSLSFQITQRFKDKRITSRTREYIFFKDGMFYVLLCGVSPEFFEKYQADFDRVAKNLTVKTF